ncbi:MAG: glycosyltransferase family 4 protein [Cyclobacteriaceae bacterium]
MSNNKILIITYYWPPSGGVGVQRWVHFALNLKKRGYEPIIYTPSNPQFEIQDINLLEKVKSLTTVKTKIWEPFSLFHKLTGNKNKGKVKQGLVLEKGKKSLKDDLIVWIRGNILIPDPRKYWRKSSVKFLKNYIEQNQIGVMVTTGPPHSMHLIGLDLKKELQQIKWISDFRDPWSNWDVLPKLMTSKFAMRKHRNWERKVLRSADLAITVSPSLAAQLTANAGKNVAVVYNGVETSQQVVKFERKDRKQFNIGYFGLLNELRDPDILWNALRKLSKSEPKFHEQLQIVFGGIISDSILEKLHSEDFFRNQIVEKGYLSHEDVFEAYQDCDLLVLLLNKTDNAKWILPQKFFEYLTAAKPILAIGPPDTDLQQIMDGKAIGKYVENNGEEISQFLLAIFEGKYEFDEQSAQELLNEFSRKNQTDQLIKLIEEL